MLVTKIGNPSADLLFSIGNSLQIFLKKRLGFQPADSPILAATAIDGEKTIVVTTETVKFAGWLRPNRIQVPELGAAA